MPELNSPAAVPVSLGVNGRVFDLILDPRGGLRALPGERGPAPSGCGGVAVFRRPRVRAGDRRARRLVVGRAAEDLGPRPTISLAAEASTHCAIGPSATVNRMSPPVTVCQ